MTMKSAYDSPILVTGAAGDLGAIGRNLTALLLAKGHKVRALVRRDDERAEALRRLGAKVIQGDLTDLTSTRIHLWPLETSNLYSSLDKLGEVPAAAINMTKRATTFE